jgi:hypothetical protein
MLALALAASIVGGLVVAATLVVAVPPWLAGVGALVCTAALLLVFVLAYRQARRTERSFGRALWDGVKTLLRWLWRSRRRPRP